MLLKAGLHSADDAASAAAMGYQLALVGSALMRSNNPAALVADMRVGGQSGGCGVSVFIKICGLRTADDVAAASAAGADAVGFVFSESVRKVTPNQAKAATEAIPTDVLRVAVMRHPSNDECRAMLDEFQPDVVQTDAEDFAELDIPGHIDCWARYPRGRRKY